MRPLPVLLLLACLLAPSWAAAACEEPSTRTEIGLTVADAMEGFRNLDAPRFEKARNKAFSQFYCLDEPLLPRDAARFHAMMAIDAFLRKEQKGLIDSFRSALSADGSYDLPPGMVPEGHILRKRLIEAGGKMGAPPRPLPAVGTDSLMVDGVVSAVAAPDRPVILQHLGPRGQVVESAYVATGEPLPAWKPVPAVVAAPTNPKPGRNRGSSVKVNSARREPHPWGLASATGLSLIATAVGYSLASQAHGDFMNPATPYAQLPDLETQANALSWAWIGTGAVTLGLGTWTILEW